MTCRRGNGVHGKRKELARVKTLHLAIGPSLATGDQSGPTLGPDTGAGAPTDSSNVRCDVGYQPSRRDERVISQSRKNGLPLFYLKRSRC